MLNIFTTLLLASVAVAAPATSSQKPKSCMDIGQTLKHWDVNNFEYHGSYVFSTPAHQIANGELKFTLSNSAIPGGFTPVCKAVSTRPSELFYGDVTFKCTDPKNKASEATFTYSHPTRELTLKQDWSCAKEGGRFFAEGGAKLKLDCKEKKWTNPKWEIGQNYSTRDIVCKKASQSVKVKKLSAIL